MIKYDKLHDSSESDYTKNKKMLLKIYEQKIDKKLKDEYPKVLSGKIDYIKVYRDEPLYKSSLFVDKTLEDRLYIEVFNELKVKYEEIGGYNVKVICKKDFDFPAEKLQIVFIFTDDSEFDDDEVIVSTNEVRHIVDESVLNVLEGES